jgi:hypothetical protein
MTDGRQVVLRDEHVGPDSRFLGASIDSNGDLMIEGHDLGPGTAPISSDGEYEWTTTIAAGDIPRLLELLGAPGSTDILEVLQTRFSGRHSYELERTIRDSGIKTGFWSWSG